MSCSSFSFPRSPFSWWAKNKQTKNPAASTRPNHFFFTRNTNSPLSPYLQKDGGLTMAFWLSLLLTLFAWIPGQLFAAWHVFCR